MTAPSDPVADPAADPVDARVQGLEVAGQWTLFWLRFRKHRLAVVSLWVVVAFYIVALFADVIAPYDPNKTNARATFAPPQYIGLLHDGGFLFHVPSLDMELEEEAMRRVFTRNWEVPVPVGFFVPSEPYKLWGWIELETKLFGAKDPDQMVYLMGADRLGRDIFSRVVHGARISLSIGLLGVGISLFLGILLGGISGWYGGWIDTAIQRVIEFLRSIPTIPLWMGMAAAVPTEWPPLWVYFMITLIVSLLAWTSLAREVRGKFMALRNEDFVVAARLDGMSDLGIIFRHLVPSFLSHIIATLTLAIPVMILAETSLSFLGIGLQPPIVSWGVLLQEAQNLRAVSSAPWLLFVPGTAVVAAILCLNFLGDGIRDAADPYGR